MNYINVEKSKDTINWHVAKEEENTTRGNHLKNYFNIHTLALEFHLLYASFCFGSKESHLWTYAVLLHWSVKENENEDEE